MRDWFDEAERLMVYCDQTTQFIIRCLILDRWLSTRRSIVDELAEEARRQGIETHKSALAKRCGNKKNGYLDGDVFLILKALHLMNEKECINYAGLPSYRCQMRRVRYIIGERNGSEE